MTLRQIVHALVWTKRHLANNYRVDPVDALARFIGPDAICIDVGAHAGSWTRPLARLVSPKGHVYAFEGLPYYSEVLGLTMSLLRLRNVTVVNRVVTDHNKPVRLKWKDHRGNRLTGLTHVVGLGEDDAEDLIEAQSTTLDEFISSEGIQPSRIAFVKGDVEGGELMVVRGAEKLIAQSRPIFYLEVNAEYCRRYGYQPADLFNFFNARKYLPCAIRGMSIAEVDGSNNESDILFLPAEQMN